MSYFCQLISIFLLQIIFKKNFLLLLRFKLHAVCTKKRVNRSKRLKSTKVAAAWGLVVAYISNVGCLLCSRVFLYVGPVEAAEAAAVRVRVPRVRHAGSMEPSLPRQRQRRYRGGIAEADEA